MHISKTAPFISISWHQKNPLGCAIYFHCPTNDSYNKCIHSCCLPCNYVTKPFGILNRVIRDEKVLISSYIWKKTKVYIFTLWKICGQILRLAFEFSRLAFLLCPYQVMSPHFKLHKETFSYFFRWFCFLILPLYQVNKTGYQKLIQKCRNSWLVLLFLDMSCLLPKQTAINNQIWINRSINKYLYRNLSWRRRQPQGVFEIFLPFKRYLQHLKWHKCVV